MGLFSAIGRAVGGAISAAVKGISKTFETVGKIFKGVTEATVDYVKKVVETVGRVLGFIDEKETVEERGDKVLQAKEHGIVPEKFDSFNEYKKKIDKFQVDESRSKEISEEDKLSAGMGYIGLSVDKEFGSGALRLLEMSFLRKNFLPISLLPQLFLNLRKTNLKAGDVASYLDGKDMKIDKKKEVSKLLVETELELGNASLEEAMDRIDSRKREIQQN